MDGIYLTKSECWTHCISLRLYSLRFNIDLSKISVAYVVAYRIIRNGDGWDVFLSFSPLLRYQDLMCCYRSIFSDFWEKKLIYLNQNIVHVKSKNKQNNQKNKNVVLGTSTATTTKRLLQVSEIPMEIWNSGHFLW